MSPGHRAACVIFAALFVTAGTASGADRPTLQGRIATTIHLYAPFNGGGMAAGVQIARTASGYCWIGSLADVRGDAFRCFVGNYIHDPCFANQIGFAHYVLCPLYSPGAQVLRINLTKKLPSNLGSGDPTRYPPWAVRTSNGEWCTIITGATDAVAGLRINYGCSGGGILLGRP